MFLSPFPFTLQLTSHVRVPKQERSAICTKQRKTQFSISRLSPKNIVTSLSLGGSEPHDRGRRASFIHCRDTRRDWRNHDWTRWRSCCVWCSSFFVLESPGVSPSSSRSAVSIRCFVSFSLFYYAMKRRAGLWTKVAKKSGHKFSGSGLFKLAEHKIITWA